MYFRLKLKILNHKLQKLTTMYVLLFLVNLLFKIEVSSRVLCALNNASNNYLSKLITRMKDDNVFYDYYLFKIPKLKLERNIGTYLPSNQVHTTNNDL